MIKHYNIRNYTVKSDIGHLIWVTSSLLRRQTEKAMARHGLTLVQWLVLRTLRDDVALTASDLCRRLHYDSGAFTRVLDFLEGRQLIGRERAARDRRVVILRLTCEGRRVVQGTTHCVIEQLNDGLQDMNATDIATLDKLLRGLIKRLEPP